MDIRVLAEWHRSQANRIEFRSGFTNKGQKARKFHLDAAELIESLADKAHERFLAITERDVKERAIESLEALAKGLLTESKDIRRMLSKEIADE